MRQSDLCIRAAVGFKNVLIHVPSIPPVGIMPAKLGADRSNLSSKKTGKLTWYAFLRHPLKIQYQKAHSECASNSYKMSKRSSKVHLKPDLLSLMNSLSSKSSQNKLRNLEWWLFSTCPPCRLPSWMTSCWRVKTWLSMRTTGNHKGGSCNHRDNMSKANCFSEVTSTVNHWTLVVPHLGQPCCVTFL